MMEIIGIIALLLLFLYMIIGGFGGIVFVHGFGSQYKFDYIYVWSIFIIGVIGFVTTLYCNVSVSING